MNIVTPNSGQISFTVRSKPVQAIDPFKVRMRWQSEETNVTGSLLVTASYDSNNFLYVTASLYTSGSNFYKFQLFQVGGCTEEDCLELYRGELYPTAESTYAHNSEPMYSYTGSNNDFIIY